MSSTVFMFSGQGSQYFHMGRDLFEKDRTFREWMLRLDDMARQASGRSVIDALYSDSHSRGDSFDQIRLTHPAIFMVEYSLAQSLLRAGLRPDMVLGVSLGSFAAAAVADFVSVDEALSAVIRQAIAVDESCEPGGMTAVLADPALFEEDSLGPRSELAAVNFDTHFVVAARRAELAEIEAGLKARNVTYQRLPVCFAFHSRWIDDAQGTFDAFMRTIPLRQGRLPLVCCQRVAVLSDLPGGYFWDVVRRPIRFRETIALLEQQGSYRYIDVGPGSTLATFLKYGLPPTAGSAVQAILTPFGADQRNLNALSASIEH